MSDPAPDKHARPAGDARCSFIFPSGRRCIEFRAGGHDSLCVYHARREDYFQEHEHRTPQAKAVVAQVLGTREEFKTATQVNDALGKLFAMRSRKLISHRDAHMLTYMCQLMLFSLHRVENDFTRTYEYKEWEKLVERALRAHQADLPPLSITNPPLASNADCSAPQVIYEFPASASSPGEPIPPSTSLRRKQKRRALPKTGREFASQVLDNLAESRAARKQRTATLLAGETESSEESPESEEREEGVEDAPAHW